MEEGEDEGTGGYMEEPPWGGARGRGLRGRTKPSDPLEGEEEREEGELWLSHNSFCGGGVEG